MIRVPPGSKRTDKPLPYPALIRSEENWPTAESRAEQVLELLELQHMTHQQARDLSGGQQRLLEMGRILMRDPKVVFLDEVAAGVHPRLDRKSTRLNSSH